MDRCHLTCPFPIRVAHRARQSGFNFAEVLFAVMILGIGFIMIAAMFPVALSQTKLTGEEAVAANTGRGGIHYLQQAGLLKDSLPISIPAMPARPVLANDSLAFPGVVYSFRDPRIGDPDGAGPLTAADAQNALWKQINGNLILPSDNRAAWVCLFRRGATYVNTEPAGGPAHPHTDPPPDIRVSPSPFAQVFVIGIQARARSTFEPAKDVRRFPADNAAVWPATPAYYASVEPKLVGVKLYEGGPNADRLSFHDIGSGALVAEPSAAEGAVIIISDDQITKLNDAMPDPDTSTAIAERNGQSNGRIYRLGIQINDSTWELQPNWDMAYANSNGTIGDADDIHENLPPRRVNPNETVPAGGAFAYAFIVGRGYADPTDPASGYEGESQITGVYTSFIPAN